jgi:hypothetical protein
MNFQHEIADLAYELYLNSGCAEGRDIENWLEAERIILARHRLPETTTIRLSDTSTVSLSEPSTIEEPKKKRVVKPRAKKEKQNGSGNNR